MKHLTIHDSAISCETCGGDGTTIIFRRFAGEAIAGEPVEVPCPDCDGVEDEPVAREPYVPSKGYTEWLASLHLTETHGDPLLNARKAA